MLVNEDLELFYFHGFSERELDMSGSCICDTNFKGDYCQLCEDGWTGEDCDIPCFADCSNNGTCIVDPTNNNASICECINHFNPNVSCDDCDSGWYGSKCNTSCTNDCNFGSCDDGMEGTGGCNCNSGYDQPTCSNCISGYYMSGTSCLECPGGSTKPCDGHGTCTSKGKCNCDTGWDGKQCGDKVTEVPTQWLAVGVVCGFLGMIGGGWYYKSVYLKKKGLSEFRVKLMEQCPELQGFEQSLEAMISDATDWFIPYEMIELGNMVGQGASSQVFSGFYAGSIVAVKRLFSLKWDPHQFELFFKQEASLLARLHHPNVILFYGVSYANNHFYIITEFCPSSLQQILDECNEKNTKMGVLTVLRVLLGISSGMYYLHSKKIVHRDLKPENVMIDDRGAIKLCDFGLSRITDATMDMTQRIGTPAFMAPELGGIENIKPHQLGLPSTATKEDIENRMKTPTTEDGGEEEEEDDNKEEKSNGSDIDSPFHTQSPLLSHNTHTSTTSTSSSMNLDGGLKAGAVDVYSFGVMIWSVWKRELPYKELKKVNPYQLMMKVGIEGYRPPIPEGMPTQLVEIMCQCWHGDPEMRPPFKEIRRVIKDMVVEQEKLEKEEREERRKLRIENGEDGGEEEEEESENELGSTPSPVFSDSMILLMRPSQQQHHILGGESPQESERTKNIGTNLISSLWSDVSSVRSQSHDEFAYQSFTNDGDEEKGEGKKKNTSRSSEGGVYDTIRRLLFPKEEEEDEKIRETK